MQTRILALLAAFIIFALTGCKPFFPNQPLTTQTPQAATADALRADLVVVSVDNRPYGTFPRSSIVVGRNSIIIPSCEPFFDGTLPDGCAKDAAALVNPTPAAAPAKAEPQPTGITSGFASYREPKPVYTRATRPLPGPNGERPPCTRPQYTCDIPPPYRADSSL